MRYAFGVVLSPLTWEYSICVEVFAMNNMLVAATIYLTTRIVLPKVDSFNQVVRFS